MRLKRYLPLLLGLLAFALFVGASQWRERVPALADPGVDGRVVIAAPLLLGLYGGDRFLAANLETMRLAATGVDLGEADTGYLIRAQHVVAELNSCHEDNYYLANGLLAWAGADQHATEILQRAMDCRFWDEVPAFYYGFNQSFFQKNIAEAARALEVAAQRSSVNAAAFRKLAVMLRVDSFADEKLALGYLIQQRDAAHADPPLHQMLDRRVTRLRGLVVLREAQRKFVAKNGALQRLEQLVEAGLLLVLPDDPLGLGYVLRDDRIILKKLKVAGVEERP